MKRIICCALSVLLLGGMLLALAGCDKGTIEGTYMSESEESDRFFVFSENLLVMYQMIDTELVEFHYTYEIREGESEDTETLVLTYKGLVYGGRDPYVSWYLTGQREQYAKDPTVTSKLVRGDGYLLINGQKFVLQK